MLGILTLFAMATDSSETTVLWGNQGSERHFLIQVKYMMSTLLVILEELQSYYLAVLLISFGNSGNIVLRLSKLTDHRTVRTSSQSRKRLQKSKLLVTIE